MACRSQSCWSERVNAVYGESVAVTGLRTCRPRKSLLAVMCVAGVSAGNRTVHGISASEPLGPLLPPGLLLPPELPGRQQEQPSHMVLVLGLCCNVPHATVSLVLGVASRAIGVSPPGGRHQFRPRNNSFVSDVSSPAGLPVAWHVTGAGGTRSRDLSHNGTT